MEDDFDYEEGYEEGDDYYDEGYRDVDLMLQDMIGDYE
jgi:hypothetical protein